MVAKAPCMQSLDARVCACQQEFLVEQGMVTHTRRAFDRALCALPITQHDRVWQLYLVPCMPSRYCLDCCRLGMSVWLCGNQLLCCSC